MADSVQMVDGRVFIRGGTIDPLVRTAERPFNIGALDTVAKTEQKLKGEKGRSGGRRMEQKTNNCLHHHSRRWRSDVTNVQEAKKRAMKTEEH